MNETTSGETRRKKTNFIVFAPFLIFVALAAVFGAQLLSGKDASTIPSALIGRPAPQLDLPPLDGLTRDGGQVPGLTNADLSGKVTLVNVWASWCAPCRQEHPLLLGLSGDERFDVVGVNYKDKPGNALRFLGELGNPYQAVGVDATGRTAIDWGVYGVPETYLVGPDATILYKHVGPLTEKAIASEILPAVSKALGSGS